MNREGKEKRIKGKRGGPVPPEKNKATEKERSTEAAFTFIRRSK